MYDTTDSHARSHRPPVPRIDRFRRWYRQARADMPSTHMPRGSARD